MTTIARSLLPTRFAAWTAWQARGLLAAFILVVSYGTWLEPYPVPSANAERAAAGQANPSDIMLYRAIADRVAAGEGYYSAAVTQHRALGYPLRPFVTVRLPTLALLEAVAGPVGIHRAFEAVCIVAWAAFVLRCREAFRGALPQVWAALCVAAALLPALLPDVSFLHEAWAGALIVLSLCLRSPGRWLASVLVAGVAVAIRELALPYLAVMAVLAYRDGLRREALAWAVMLAVGVLGLAAHAVAVASHVSALDRQSAGWVAAGGWQFIISMIGSRTIVALAPPQWTALIATACLLGWAASPGPFGVRAALTLGGYVTGFLLIGRPDNVYWAFLIAPLLLPGMAAAPAALRDLGAAALRRPLPSSARSACARSGPASSSATGSISA